MLEAGGLDVELQIIQIDGPALGQLLIKIPMAAAGFGTAVGCLGPGPQLAPGGQVAGGLDALGWRSKSGRLAELTAE